MYNTMIAFVIYLRNLNSSRTLPLKMEGLIDILKLYIDILTNEFLFINIYLSVTLNFEYFLILH